VAAIANVALSNTFDEWRIRTNQSFTRLNQFAVNESSLYANTITANVAFTSAGLLTASGRATIGTNLNVSGNTTLGGSAKTTTATGLVTVTGRQTISTNLDVSGNTSLSTGSGNTVINLNSARITDYCEHAVALTNSGTTQTIAASSNVVRYTLTGNLTLTLPSGQPEAAPAVKTIVVYLKQDGVGTRTVTFAAPAGESISYNNSATQPAAQTGASKVSIYTCMKFDADPVWYISLSYIDD